MTVTDYESNKNCLSMYRYFFSACLALTLCGCGFGTKIVLSDLPLTYVPADFISVVAPRREAEKIYLSNYIGDIVVNPIINDSLEIYAGPYTGGIIELSDINDGQIVVRDSLSNHNT